MELTSEVAKIGYICTLVTGLLFFALHRRRFDFLPVAYVGAAFYFLPLISGHVLQSSPLLITSIQPIVYIIASAFLLALMAAALAPQTLASAEPVSSELAAPLLVLAVVGLVGALIDSRGAVIQLDKVESLEHIGVLYVLFETAASLACIAAVVERRWHLALAAAVLLAIDLLAGFRNYATLTSLAVATVLLARQGPIRLYRKSPTYGAGLAVVVLVMLLTHSARYVIFDRIASVTGDLASEQSPSMVAPPPAGTSDGSANTPAAPAPKTVPSRSDTIQFQEATRLRKPPTPSDASSQADKAAEPPGQHWLLVMKRLIEQSEPYMIQATLVATIQTNLSCRASNILKSAWVLVPPGMLSFAPKNPYPATFYQEYQPILYPKITYGTAGNIWAEMLCRFGLVGVVLFGAALVLLLLWIGRLLVTASPAFLAPIAFAGTILAFYIHRNDLNFTLVMIKQTAYVFAAAYVLLRLKEKIASYYPRT